MAEEKIKKDSVGAAGPYSVNGMEEAPRPFLYIAALLLFAAGICLVCFGQMVIFFPRWGAIFLSKPFWKTLVFLPPYYPKRVSLAIIFLAASGILFSLLFLLARTPSELNFKKYLPTLALLRAAKRLRLHCWLIIGALVVIGAKCEISLLKEIYHRATLVRPFEIWVISIFSFALLFGLLDRWFHRSLKNPLTKGEWIFVGVLTLGAVALYSFDLLSYKYSYIGDEYCYYFCARDICIGKGWADNNIFSERGVDLIVPRLWTYYQAAVMKVFGVNNFGWRFSAVLITVGSFLPLYIFLKLILSRRAAIWGTLFLCFSHYSMAFAHIGFSKGSVTFPTVLTLCFLVLAYRYGSSLGFFLCGVGAGLGFYTFYTSRLAVGFVVVMFIIKALGKTRSNWLLFFVCFILGFTVTVAPIIFSSSPAEFMRDMERVSILKYRDAKDFGAIARILLNPELTRKMINNTLIVFLSPLYYNAKSHFVSWTLLDAVTSSFFVIGFFYALFRVFRNGIYAFLLIIFAISVLVLGITTPYKFPPTTRMLFMVPISCLFAALGAERFFTLLVCLLGGRRIINWLLIPVIAGAMIWMNLYRMYIEMPTRNGFRAQALVIRYLKKAPEGRKYYYLIPDTWSNMPYLHTKLYNVDDKVEIYHFKKVVDDPSLIVPPCTIIFNYDCPGERQNMVKSLRGWFSTSELERIPGPSVRRAVYLLEVQ